MAIAQSGYSVDCLTVQQTAEKLQVCRKTVYNLVKQKKLTKLKILGSTRFNKAEVEALLLPKNKTEHGRPE